MTGMERRVRTRLILSLVLMSVSAAPAWAQQPDTAASRVHVVRKGDTLWDIARTYLADPFQWPRIYDRNRGIIRDPHWIYPNQQFVLPGSLLRQDARLLGDPLTWTAVQDAAAQDVALVAAELEEEGAEIAQVDLRRPPMLASQYRATPWLAPSGLGASGRVVRLADPSVASGSVASLLHEHAEVHVALGGFAVGDSLQVVRAVRNVMGRGSIIQPLALLSVDSIAAEVAVATVRRVYGQARVGDAVIRADAVPDFALGTPTVVQNGAQGEVVAMLDDQPLYGTTDVGFVNIGAGAVAIGDELEVYVPQRDASGVGDMAPPERVGVLRVVRIEGPNATVRVMEVDNTALRAGLPVRVIRTIQ